LLHLDSFSPDLIVCDFLLWGYVKYCVYNLPLPAMMAELRRCIIAAIDNITHDMLERIWRE
ncbi:hypothetical protein C0J52_00578, partial [Blattella germanica]